MKFDKHRIQCQIECPQMTGGAACCDGKIAPLWKRMQEMAGDRKILGWTFWVTLKRGPIEITANGSNIAYADVEHRAERVLLLAEAALAAEHDQ